MASKSGTPRPAPSPAQRVVLSEALLLLCVDVACGPALVWEAKDVGVGDVEVEDEDDDVVVDALAGVVVEDSAMLDTTVAAPKTKRLAV